MTTKELVALAENGDPEAQFHLAGRYKKGIRVRKSLSKAVEWYTKAAEQGDREAKERLLSLS